MDTAAIMSGTGEIEPHLAYRLGDGQGNEAEAVGADRQDEKERNHPVPAEQNSGGEVAEREVHGQQRSPAAHEHRFFEGPHQDAKQQERNDRDSDRAGERQRRAPPGVHHTTRRRRFDDLFGDQAEERDHRDIVDQEPGRLHDAVVAFGIGVRPDQRQCRAERQVHDVLGREVPELGQPAAATVCPGGSGLDCEPGFHDVTCLTFHCARRRAERCRHPR